MPVLWPIYGRHRDRAFPRAKVCGVPGRGVVVACWRERNRLMMTSATHMWSTQLGAKKRTARAAGVPGTCRGCACRGGSLQGELLACMLLCVLLLSPVSAQVIHPLQEDGRTVFVNDGTVASKPAVKTAAGNPPAFEYWSNTERRWKPLPPASSGLLRRARVAAAEVQSFVEARPPAKRAPEEPSATTLNYRYPAQSQGSSPAEIDRIIEEAAARHHVDPNLVRAVIKVESNFNPAAVSRRGAMGLMQLMPATARKFNVSNPFDPRQNVEAGVRHLKRLLDNFGGDVGLTLAAYNAGEAAVNRNNGVPPYAETQRYLRQFKVLYDGKTGTLISSSAPIHISRDGYGVLTITNVE